MKTLFSSYDLVKVCLINFILFLSFGLSSQINSGFLTLKPVVAVGYPPGSVDCLGSPTAIVDVVSPTGKTWMDRNLGASQVATSSTDALAYGDLYQWGRFSDGHQCRTSATTTTNSATNTPGHGDFILEGSSPYDWRDPQYDSLWQGVSKVNNPCPAGYRLPTTTEWTAERDLWVPQNAAQAFASVLKLPVAGGRSGVNGSLSSVGSIGFYWSSGVSGTNARYFYITSGASNTLGVSRASGYAVRCIKE